MRDSSWMRNANSQMLTEWLGLFLDVFLLGDKTKIKRIIQFRLFLLI